MHFIDGEAFYVVAGQLLEHMTKNPLNESLQSAYRQMHSTETALLHAQNDLLRVMDNKQGVIHVLLDLSAAFGTIDHNVLLSPLVLQYWYYWPCTTVD